MKELSKQLQGLLEKSFIRLSSSPRGASVLFMTEKGGWVAKGRLDGSTLSDYDCVLFVITGKGECRSHDAVSKKEIKEPNLDVRALVGTGNKQFTRANCKCHKLKIMEENIGAEGFRWRRGAICKVKIDCNDCLKGTSMVYHYYRGLGDLIHVIESHKSKYVHCMPGSDQKILYP
ncbi:hypothetical protein Tco_0769407 [Tanacetum coccineum]|uniref:Uncharacterized protein n=1 Tax=Tanacetum coccineum TaxID=301880 RepID=A0ABQ4ZB41_9ASTR